MGYGTHVRRMPVDNQGVINRHTIDAVAVRHGAREGLAHADTLAEAVLLDMRKWWTPSVEGFYQRLPKSALAHAVTEARCR